MTYHVPVLAREVLDGLRIASGKSVLDATLGGGGHALAFAETLGPDGLLIGVDQDPEALAEAGNKLAAAYPGGPRVHLIHARFDRLGKPLEALGIAKIDACLFDLGVSSHQLDEPNRGFSFRDVKAPLDMRMDQTAAIPTAADLINTLPERELTAILRDYADEAWAARIAQFLVTKREEKSLRTTGDVIDVVMAAIPAKARSKDINPATRTFQALRIAVNNELTILEDAIKFGIGILNIGGRIAVISYHSGEDRIAKRTLQILAGRCHCPPRQPVCTCGALSKVLKLVTKKPIAPGAEEIAANPRSRSARLRIAEKIAE